MPVGLENFLCSIDTQMTSVLSWWKAVTGIHRTCLSVSLSYQKLTLYLLLSEASWALRHRSSVSLTHGAGWRNRRTRVRYATLSCFSSSHSSFCVESKGCNRATYSPHGHALHSPGGSGQRGLGTMTGVSSQALRESLRAAPQEGTPSHCDELRY